MPRYMNSADALHTLKQLAYETAINQFDIDVADVFEDIAKNRLETWVDLIPTVDAVEVVRCKDCIYWEQDVIFEDGWCRGKHQGNPYWFCADGKRKETEDETN